MTLKCIKLLFLWFPRDWIYAKPQNILTELQYFIYKRREKRQRTFLQPMCSCRLWIVWIVWSASQRFCWFLHSFKPIFNAAHSNCHQTFLYYSYRVLISFDLVADSSSLLLWRTAVAVSICSVVLSPLEHLDWYVKLTNADISIFSLQPKVKIWMNLSCALISSHAKYWVTGTHFTNVTLSD